jgi:aspartate aminotransferase-like enzyme
MNYRLFTPGPVEVPERILRVLGQPSPHHRTDGFRDTMRRVTESLRALHGTEGEVFMLAASGTGAMEAAVVNLMARGERSLVIAGGKFGERWAAILKAYGLAAEVLEVEWGSAVNVAEVGRRLDADPSLAKVFATHSETSTGALHDVRELARACRLRQRVLVVDAVTSLGVHPLPQDEWGVDVVVCGSQKGLMIPPGLATVSIAPWAANLIEGDRPPRFYFDLRKARKSAPQGETAFTPPVGLVLALEESLAMMKEEGLAQVHDRHRRLAQAARAAGVALGFGVFSSSPSNAVTALTAPAGIETGAVVKRLRETHGIVVAGGQDQLKGKILRIGHMGGYTLADIQLVAGALEECVAALGRPGSGALAAAASAWNAA